MLPSQQRFVAATVPIAAIMLAKAYIRPAGQTTMPYGVLADATLVGLLNLAWLPERPETCWLFHFFIDWHFQGRGYGGAALQACVRLLQREHPTCARLLLTVHPDNQAAQRLYTRAGFTATGEVRDGEPIYQLRLPPGDAPAAPLDAPFAR